MHSSLLHTRDGRHTCLTGIKSALETRGSLICSQHAETQQYISRLLYAGPQRHAALLGRQVAGSALGNEAGGWGELRPEWRDTCLDPDQDAPGPLTDLDAEWQVRIDPQGSPAELTQSSVPSVVCSLTDLSNAFHA